MRLVLMPFLGLAALGFVLSVISHACAHFGVDGPLGGRAMWLHFGIFVVWIPTMVAAKSLSRGFDKPDHWRAVLRGCPGWMRRLMTVCFLYAIANFLAFLISVVTHPIPGRVPPGAPAPPRVIRGFSGHWMVFYAAACSTLYSYLAVRATEQQEALAGKWPMPRDEWGEFP